MSLAQRFFQASNSFGHKVFNYAKIAIRSVGHNDLRILLVGLMNEWHSMAQAKHRKRDS